MNELPQVSSTTSLSDNPQLRQYYDKFLFKNSSGKSLSDLPAKAREQARSNLHMEEGFGAGAGAGAGAGGGTGQGTDSGYDKSVRQGQEQGQRFQQTHGPGHGSGSISGTGNVDFISGFRNPMYQTNASPVSSSGSHSVSMSYSDAGVGPQGSGHVPGSSSMFHFDNGNGNGNTPRNQPFGMVPLSESGQSQDYSVMGSGGQQQQHNLPVHLQGPPQFVPGAGPGMRGSMGPPPQQNQNQIQNQNQDQNQNQNQNYGQGHAYGTSSMGVPHSRNGSIASANSVSPSSYYAALNQTVSPTDQLSPLNSAGGSNYGAGTVNPSSLTFGHDASNFIDNLHSSGRRSSYVSDALIHGHAFNNQGSNFTIGAGNNQQRFFNPQRQSVSGAVSAGGSGFQNPRNFHQAKHNSFSSGSSGPASSTLVPPSGQQNSQLSLSMQTNTNHQTVSAGLPQQGTFPLDNGLLLQDGQIISSQSLSQLYKECGENFFASKFCHEFVDSVKALISGTSENQARGDKVQKFLGFLKSCNLNYNPQSDAFVSTGKHRRSSTSSYLHYRPLVLVALKNGKLELLSLPQGSNLNLARDDLIIIDGDRGKDLAVCIDPVVQLKLALFINFLKKKIHFDSLITSRNQHYPTAKFIDALMNSASGSQDDLNPKLYDVIELTQLIIPSKQILRFATPWECFTNLHSKFQDELKALHIAQLKLKTLNSNNAANGKPSLNIKILNSEFQFDRKKLTFYYICQERNDFRELIKELFKFYKTRIWLCAIPNNLEIDSKYYDNERKEWAMYEDMMKHFQQEDLIDNNLPPQTGFVVAPSLKKIQLDNFQIGVYKELVNSMF
ncbi:unnamed protein product [Kluyveromyces dobzhanskii CBS 2104]|uniref:WGS project CCBQ000000000 data, contig MAT n=1 Tax=Kluyveromyces dobzhanskii CBS 2104 TaxID=1427455 RepID=A0A0A8L157_9SACH|nr:unnamed protein product [Kluyveromyces dobzhanskii CBS 2104]